MTTFLLNPDEFVIPGLRNIHDQWISIPDDSVRSMIVVESQYLAFHRYLLNSLTFRWRNENEGTMISGRLSHSVRAGAVKAAILLYASIAEAALRAHAEHRGYNLPKQERHRTFGTVIAAWDKAGKAEAVAVWDELVAVKDHRNLIHLYKAADENKDWQTVLKAENDLIEAGEKVLTFLKSLNLS